MASNVVTGRVGTMAVQVELGQDHSARRRNGPTGYLITRSWVAAGSWLILNQGAWSFGLYMYIYSHHTSVFRMLLEEYI